MARAHKGPRGFISLRAPEDQHAVYIRRAAELGIDNGEYAVLMLALAHGFDPPDYIKLTPEQRSWVEQEVAASHALRSFPRGA